MTGVIVPLIGVLFGYTAIFLKVRSSKSQIRQHRKSHSASAVACETATGIVTDVAKTIVDRPNKRPIKPSFTVDDVKLAKTLFVAFLLFLICWLPFAMFVAVGQPDAVPRWIYVVAIILAHGNSAANPILYGLTNDKFRQGYRKVLCMSPTNAVAEVVPVVTGRRQLNQYSRSDINLEVSHTR